MSDRPRGRGRVVGALRDAAQTEILPRFRNLSAGDINTRTGPEDLVTVADRAAKAMLALSMATLLSGAEFDGEEAVSDDPDILTCLMQPGLTVIVDPIDGTSNFAHGNATFGMILAIAAGDRKLLGVLYDPILDDWIAATGTDTRTTMADLVLSALSGHGGGPVPGESA